MTYTARSLTALALAVVSCFTLAAAAQAGGYGGGGRPVRVLLPPGPCIAAGGHIEGLRQDRVCVAPEVLLPPGPCVRAGGRMAEKLGGGRACIMPEARARAVARDPQSGLPTGQQR